MFNFSMVLYLFCCVYEIGTITHYSKDYDFPDADDLFAGREIVYKKIDPSFVQPRWSHLTWNKTKEKNPEVSPQSPIGYEVACGIRCRNCSVLSDERIVGGTNARRGEFPWQVSLQLITGWITRHICGGAVVSAWWVVTAGHCVYHLKPSALIIVAGDHDLFKDEGMEQRREVVRIINAGYKPGNFTDDLALLQLKDPLVLDGQHVAPICLPNPTVRYNGGNGTVSGWGKLTETGSQPQILQHVNLPILQQHQCKKMYEEAGIGNYLDKCHLCAGYKNGGHDTCKGDSGGPLVCKSSDKRYYLCGIVSWGLGCARPKLPGAYTQVSCYSNWIKNILYNVNDTLHYLPSYNQQP